MTSPTGRGNTNPGFIFDDGSSNTGGNSTRVGGDRSQGTGGVRGIAAGIYDWFQHGRSSGGNITSQTDGASRPNPPVITAQPGPSGGVNTSANIQTLLGLLTQGGTAPAPTSTPIPAPTSTPAPNVDPSMQALLNLLAQATGGTVATPNPSPTQPMVPIVTTQPVPGITIPQANAPTPGVQALLTLLTQATGGTVATPTPAPLPIPVMTQPVAVGNQTQQMLQTLLSLFAQSPGGISGQGSQLLIGLLQGVASTSGPYQQGAQSILSLLQGQNGAALQQGLGALANLVSGQGTTSSNIGTAVQALSGLAGLAGPAGVAVGSLASIIAAAATSESARRGGRFCYDNCHTCCEGNCCCPRCGCSDGQCGCGSLGRCLCGLFGNCCGVQVDSRRALEKELQEIEDEFGDSIFLMALSNLGMDTVGLLSGSTALTLPSMDRIREECRNCSRDLPGILKNKTNAMWTAAAQGYRDVLKNTFLRGCFVSGMASSCDINTNQLKDCIRVLHKWGGDGGVIAASQFDMERLALTLPELTVTSRRNPAVGPLGVITAAAVMQDLGKILMKASHGGRQIWINVNDLMTLVCMILAYRGICVVSDAVDPERARIYERGRIRQLIIDVDNRRLMNERNRGPAPYVPSINPYADLAARCFAEHAQRAERMRNPGDASRQQLLTSLSSRWMLAAGITPTTPVTTQPPASTAPIITRATVSGLRATPPTGEGQNERNYDEEGARPRGGNGTNQGGNNQGQGGNGNNNRGGNTGGVTETRV
ncbi:hypothetical protein SBV42_04060 [Chlamydia crocodili]|uniref:Uncharacterized protein n=1 Tax=Chlamydia crocodili TaxID=2766982 RepID=A0ABX8CD42_9CHLA|nr:hypothetical protein [Chlamydia crocodili]QVE48934.1 hypothetical protein H9Q19_04430 [Chlamydia crocodili]